MHFSLCEAQGGKKNCLKTSQAKNLCNNAADTSHAGSVIDTEPFLFEKIRCTSPVIGIKRTFGFPL